MNGGKDNKTEKDSIIILWYWQGVLEDFDVNLWCALIHYKHTRTPSHYSHMLRYCWVVGS